jgi:hypothetical protein
MKQFATIVLPQLDELISTFEDLGRRTKHYDFSDIDRDETSSFILAGLDAIHRIAGTNSQYATQLDDLIKKLGPYDYLTPLPHVAGALKALRRAVASGYLVTLQELMHADLFSDFLEMAEHLLKEGYKDPAAVLIGGVLEEHLRKLCAKNGIALEYLDARGVLHPTKAETMNMDLASNNVYSKLDQKSVTAWLDLRNKAAHGQYGDYTSQQVEFLLQQVRDFLVRLPA